ncbi:hypothetical protein E4U28_005653, partial [Claviceps purpurea]
MYLSLRALVAAAALLPLCFAAPPGTYKSRCVAPVHTYIRMHKETVNVVSAGTSRPVVIPDAYLSDYFALLASLSQIKVLNTYKARQVADCSPATNIQSLSSTSGPAAAPTVNPECICTDDYNPVCAGGQTYPNACTAICYGAFLGYWGPCKDPQPADPC